MATNEPREIDRMPVINDLKDFDKHSGVLMERIIFNYRHLMIIGCIIISIVLGWQTSKLYLNASFEKMLPQHQPYIKNYIANKKGLKGLGNTIRIVVENTEGTIFNAQYIEFLKQISDEVFLIPGVERSSMKSLWTPTVRWTMVTEKGFTAGSVIPDTYDGSEASLQTVKTNVGRASLVGSLVADNYKSSLILVSLIDKDPATGKRLSYSDFSKNIENVRQKYENQGKGAIKIHITGFAKIVGDLIEGLKQVMVFFLFAVLIAGCIIFLYSRCLRSTVLLICCSALAVLWQLGLIRILGFELDPYSILVPFLVYAIAVSHGTQKMNGIMQDIGRGTHKLIAARYTFRRLFLPGLTALSAAAVGFAVLMRIDIPVIRDLALTASVGVAVVIFTNLILLPVLLSYTGVSPLAAKRSLMEESKESKGKGIGAVWEWLERFASRPKWSAGAVIVLILMTIGGSIVGHHVKIGDLDPGAPEFRPDSRYNQDNAFLNANFGLSTDQFAVIVKTPKEGCINYQTLIEVDRLVHELEKVPGVQSVGGVSDAMRLTLSGSYEGSPKFYTITRNQRELNYAGSMAVTGNPELFDKNAQIMPVIAYLSDHKADTLERVVEVASNFSKNHSTEDRKFLLAAGSSGIEAATNIIVKRENRIMMIYVYIAVILLCLVTFRSWRAVIVAIIPLILTSVLCESLMVMLGIGVKVATLPVIALGVGIGVDYALYLLSVQLEHMRAGLPLGEAYKRAVRFTGKVVALVGITLASAVVTWSLSPIKFQADMGILLSFMFFYNMVGALVFIPSLSRFILGRADETGQVFLKGMEQNKTSIVSQDSRSIQKQLKNAS